MFCNIYGTALFASGFRQGRGFTRLLALGIIVAPAVRRALSAGSIPVNELAWLLLTTGSALAGVGLMAKRVRSQEGEVEAEVVLTTNTRL